MTAIEIIAATFGLISVLLTIFRNVWCWPTGLVQVALYVGIFFQAKLYSDCILHVIYVFLQVYGWWSWKRAGRASSAEFAEIKIERLSRGQLAAWIVAVVAGTAAWESFMSHATDAAFPFADAFVETTSLAATYLLAWRKLENWLLWILVDVVAIPVFLCKDLYATSELYALFLGLAISGLAVWWKRWLRQGKSLVVP